MGKSEKRELANRMALLLAHLLKWKHQPNRRGSSWQKTIRIQRKEIAYELGLSPKTVDVHRARIMERLQLSDIASLTLYAVRKGLIKP